MNINTNIYKQYVKSGSSKRSFAPYGYTPAGKTVSAKTDSFSLSSEASMFKECGKVIRASVSEITSPADDSRINSLKQQIRNGTYNVSSEQIADAILDRIA